MSESRKNPGDLGDEQLALLVSEHTREKRTLTCVKSKSGPLFVDDEGYIFRVVRRRDLLQLTAIEQILLGQLEHAYDKTFQLYIFCIFGPANGAHGQACFHALVDALDQRDESRLRQGEVLRRSMRSN